jgi:hypothetical protein
MFTRFFKKAHESRSFLTKGRLFWLGFLFPCLGAAQDFSEVADNARDSQFEVDEDCCEDEAMESEAVITEQQDANASITLDFLYFYSMLENLRYAEKVPQELNNNTPVIANVEQKFSYDPGARINLMIALDNYWELGATWTYYDASPDSTSAHNDAFGIYSSMQAPVFVTTGHPQCKDAKGMWGMRMNVFDVEFKKPFCIGNVFMFSPVIGAQGVLFRNTLRVSYDNFRIIKDEFAETPQRLRGTNDIWAVGPEVAIETRFLAPRKLDLFVRAAYSGMLGQFNAKTVYTDFLFTDGSGSITIRNNSARLFSMWQIQAAFSKRWDIGQGLIELMAGYETQYWTGVNRWDTFGTLSIPSSDGNLMLSGPFGRLTISF